MRTLIIDSNLVADLTKIGKSQTTIENIGKTLRVAELDSITVPAASIAVFNRKNGGSFAVNTAVLLLKYLSLPTSGLDSPDFIKNVQHGQFVKGVRIQELATISELSEIGEVKINKESASPEQLLYAAIRASVRSEIDKLNLLLSGVTDEILAEYVALVENNTFANFNGLTVDTSATLQAIGKAKLADALNKIDQCFLVGKTSVELILASDLKTVEVQLANWDKNNEKHVIEALTSHGFSDVKFDADKSGTLARLRSQLAVVTLPIVAPV